MTKQQTYQYGIMVSEIDHKIGYGYAFLRNIELLINVNKYEPINGSSYIELPSFIQNKGAVINVNNSDNECFNWAVLSALHVPQRDPKNTLNPKKNLILPE